MEKLGKFELREQIGRGAMAEVFKAWDPSMKRWVAVKKIKSEFAENVEQLERFIDEAVTAGNLDHPNIVTVFESGRDGDRPFIAMAYLDGGSLDKVIQSRAALPLSQKVGYIVHVCRALAYAHRQKVVHRDIKPSNVMLTADGVVKVVDFGIARLGDSARTQTGTVMGTLGYMSPELIEGRTADPRSDVWAVGIMFFELLSLQRPFNGDNPAALMTNIQSLMVPSILEEAPDTPLDLATVIERMLRKRVNERYQSMDEVLIELEPIWRRLQETEVANLVAVSKQLFDVRDLVGAQNAAIKALQIDTGNIEAKAILDKIKLEFRRREILPKIEAHVEKGQKFLSLGQIQKARLEAEAALELDSASLPAHELLGQVEIAAEKARALERDLRVGKQRLAEGAITEAEIQLTKVLESDPKNTDAQDLLKQIRAEKTRRERQKRLSDLLRSARVLWTDFQYDECIQLLLDSREEFPDEREIEKLLETARQDKAEQERQSLLGEARKFLRAENFDEAIKTLENVLARFPEDNAAKSLYRLVLQGQEQQLRDRQFQSDLAGLRELIKEGKYKEAIERGEQLFKTFPDEFQLADLVAYARAENANQEIRRRQEEQLDHVSREIQNGRFREAILAAEASLKEFPQSSDFAVLIQRAKAQQAEKEKQELRDRRLAEIKALIGRGDLPAAIVLTRQTLEAVGPETEIRRLQLQAQAELDRREKRRQKQQEILAQARGLLDRGRLAEAGRVLQQAVLDSLLADMDAPVVALRREIEEKQREVERVALERQRRLAEIVRRGRALWSASRHRECIEVMQEAQKEFPEESEVVKLLEMARRDEAEREKAEKYKQEQMGEARKLVGARQYEGALRLLDELLKQASTDAAVRELRAVAQKGLQEQARERQLREEIESLKNMVDAGRFQDAILLGEKLRLDFPGEVEIGRLVDAARNAQIRIERKHRHEQLIQQVTQEFQKSLFRETILAAANALKEFPESTELAALLESAKGQLAEKTRRERRDKLVAEIESNVFKGDLTGALDLVKLALEEVGSDREIRRLQLKAEAELEQLEKKKQKEQQILDEARALLNSGKFGDAGKVLQQAVDASLLSQSDTRMTALRREIEEKRIQQERAAQERQRRLAEAVRRGRTLWTALRFRECIEVMQEAQKEFPEEAEVVKLLEMARHDEAEREKTEKYKQEQIGEARKLVGARQYDGALGILDRLLQQWPTDGTAKELRAVAEQGRQEQIREKQFKEDVAALKKLVDDGKYQDAVAKGEKLRLANPRDVEIPKLIAEAKSGQARLERKQQLDQWNERIGAEIKNGRFREAIKVAETALKEFPQNPGLATLLDRAKTQQSEKEKREVLDKRIAEIRTKIGRDDLAGAIKLAVRTLEDMGPDAGVGQLLQSAKMELEQREQKKRDQEDTLRSAETLVRSGNLADATKVLDRSVQTGLFLGSDRRLDEIRRDIEKRQARLNAEASKAEARRVEAQKAEALQAEAARSAALKEQARKAEAEARKAEELRAAALKAEARRVEAQKAEALQAEAARSAALKEQARKAEAEARKAEELRAAALKEEERRQAAARKAKPPEKPVESKVHEEQTRTFAADDATVIVRPAAQEQTTRTLAGDDATLIVRPSAQKQTAAERPASAKQVEDRAASEDVASGAAEESRRVFWKSPIAIGALALIAIGGIVTIILLQPRGPKRAVETPEELKVEHGLMSDADGLMAGSPRRFADSLAGYQKLADMHQSLEKEARRKAQQVQDFQRQENGWMEKGKQAKDSQNYTDALTDYKNAVGLNGDREKEAEDAASTVNKLIHGMSQAQVAQANFMQAGTYLGQKQWERARLLYRQVEQEPEAPPDLRNQSREKEALASAHLTEEDLFARANSTRASDPQGAKVLYQKVVEMHLDHEGEALGDIKQIDEGTKKEAALKALEVQIQHFIEQGTAESLQQAKQKYQEFLNSGGQDTTGLGNEIGDLERRLQEGRLKALDIQIHHLIEQGTAESLQEAKQKYQDFLNSGGRDTTGLGAEIGDLEKQLQEERARYQAAEAAFQSAVARRDSETLRGKVSEEFRNFAGSRTYASAAKEYVENKIPAAILAITRQNPPDDRALIAEVLKRYQAAYNGKRAADIQAMWPSISKKTLGEYTVTFKNVSMIDYQLKYDKSTFQVSGDGASATAAADYSVSMTQLGQTQNASGKVTFNLQKTGGAWYIVSLQ